MKTVRQYYNITEEDLENLEGECLDETDNRAGSDYWQKSRRFLHQKLDMREHLLTDKERLWLESILETIQKSKY